MPGIISVSRPVMTSVQSTDAQHEINVFCQAGYDKMTRLLCVIFHDGVKSNLALKVKTEDVNMVKIIHKADRIEYTDRQKFYIGILRLSL